METKFDAKNMLGFRHLPCMNGGEAAKSETDHTSTVTELDRIYNKIGEIEPEPMPM